MVFSSIIFLYYFLPITILIYYITPKCGKNLVFLLASLFFYAWGEPVYVFLMLFSILINYFIGLGLTSVNVHRKKVLVIGCIFNLALIGVFKYTGFTLTNLSYVLSINLPIPEIALPLGISFFTFQAMSYLFDVYRNEAKPQKSPWALALYITAFPQLVAGPIVRYTSIMEQIHGRKHTLDGMAEGVKRFTIGLAKKVLLANPLGQMVDSIFVFQGADLSFTTAWIGAIAYALQIYFDFSGYSDMAIGLGKMFGFRFEENFRYPYISTSISEFWRRWHISLGSWFRDYVYIPLGGNRQGTMQMVRNLFIVWFLTGLWHGASWVFVIWGLYYGCFIMVEKLLQEKIRRIPKVVMRLYTVLVIIIGWVFFRSDSLSGAISYLSAMFGLGPGAFCDSVARLYLHDQGILFVVAIIGCTPYVAQWFQRAFGQERKLGYQLVQTVTMAMGVCVLLYVCTICLVNSVYNPFIYFRF